MFLDEVGDLSLSAQAKLLRAIQDLTIERVGGHGLHRVDTRVVAATNQSLSGLVEARAFRADLFYRLSGIEVHVPPLRERREDIVELAGYFLIVIGTPVTWSSRGRSPKRCSPTIGRGMCASSSG